MTEFNVPLAELLDAYNAGVHDESCGMLHHMVADDDWRACGCWFGRARTKLLAAKMLPEIGVGTKG